MREDYAPDDPREWLRMAREDLNLAKAEVQGVGFEPLCFHAQQAAEKSIKCVLLFQGTNFPYVHDLGELLTLVQSTSGAIPERVDDADQLTRFAVLSRYPSVGEISKDDYDNAIEIASAAVAWADQEIRNESAEE